jgi:hypothetical protein
VDQTDRIGQTRQTEIDTETQKDGGRDRYSVAEWI